MTSGIIQNLARASRIIANEPDPRARFGMLVGFLCDIALQNDIDGLWIAVDRGVDDYVPASSGEGASLADLGVPIIRDDEGQVVDLALKETEFADDPYVGLAREIALLPDPEVRTVALEAAAIELIREDDAAVAELLIQVERVRRGNLALEEVGVLLARDQRALPAYAPAAVTLLH